MEKEELIKKYSFNKADYKKYMPAGGVLLEYIGQIIIRVKFTRDPFGVWSEKVDKVFLLGMDDFEPVNMTYKLRYKTLSGEIDEIRVIQEGYSFGRPEDTGEMTKFLPYSYHCRLFEDEVKYARLQELFDTRDTLGLEELKSINSSKGKAEILRYSHNIQAIIKFPDTNGVVAFRVLDLKLLHTSGPKYSLEISSGDEKFTLEINSKDTSYEFMSGTLKLINLKGYINVEENSN